MNCLDQAWLGYILYIYIYNSIKCPSWPDWSWPHYQWVFVLSLRAVLNLHAPNCWRKHICSFVPWGLFHYNVFNSLYCFYHGLCVCVCRHVFHKSCVDPWLLDQRSCPMCKLDILRAYGMQVWLKQATVLSLFSYPSSSPTPPHPSPFPPFQAFFRHCFIYFTVCYDCEQHSNETTWPHFQEQFLISSYNWTSTKSCLVQKTTCFSQL